MPLLFSRITLPTVVPAGWRDQIKVSLLIMKPLDRTVFPRQNLIVVEPADAAKKPEPVMATGWLRLPEGPTLVITGASFGSRKIKVCPEIAIVGPLPTGGVG